ncbi:MAG: hypothetical protein WDO13_09515 [Verrucomicrobiota bacterium]
MRLTFLSDSYFAFDVPAKDASFASSVGPRTVYPAGFSLEQALEIYWRAKDYTLVATGNGARGGLTQALTVNQNLPPRNATVGTDSFFEVDGFTPIGPGDLTTGYGLRQVIPGGGTITASGDSGSGTNPAAVFNLQVNLFFPEVLVSDPVVKFDGLWWPAMSVSCSVTNTVTVSGGGRLSISYACDTFNPASTVPIGTMSFFGVTVPVSCAPLASGETRTFSGSLVVADEFP